ncbi:MAG: ceramidase domain-containing protein [Bacteriovoracaceae bacterium]
MKEEILRAGVGCPWHPMRESWGYPNLKWCEESLCQWIEEPANTWSNLGYIAVAIYIFMKGKKSGSIPMTLLGLAVFFMGLFSLIYHATNNWPTQILDFAGMYFYTSAIILFNLRRLGWVKENHSAPTYLILLLANFLLIPLFNNVLHIHIQFIILVNVITMMALEFLVPKDDSKFNRRYFYMCLGTFAIAETFSLLDVKRIMCDPTMHVFQGHALWHWIGALAVFYSYKHYSQFDSLMKEQK